MTGNITELVFKRFGVGAFSASSRTKVACRRIGGRPDGAWLQYGFTIPRDLFDDRDRDFLYEVHRDNDGNYVFIKTGRKYHGRQKHE